ncbi:MAG: hypothetical protein IH586_22535, partial [Anaerolineaceae bacterium]|nr:hypothetical protein [Anaerolineaceae bacterium]
MKYLHRLFVLLGFVFLAFGCNTPTPAFVSSPQASFSPQIVLLTVSPTLTATPSLVPTFSLTPSITPQPSSTLTPEPPGCQKPLDDYTRIEVNGWILNQRTLSMLEKTALLYG